MVPNYFDMRFEENSLRFVFELSKKLVDFYESMSEIDLRQFAEDRRKTHRFFLIPYKEQIIKAARDLFVGEFFGLGKTIRIERNDSQYVRLIASIPDRYGVKDLAENLYLLFDLVKDLVKISGRPAIHRSPLLMAVNIEAVNIKTNGFYSLEYRLVGRYTQEFQKYLEYLLKDSPRFHQVYYKTITNASLMMKKSYNFMKYGPRVLIWDDDGFMAEIGYHDDETKRVFFELNVKGVALYTSSRRFNKRDYWFHEPIILVTLLAGLAYLCGSAKQWLVQE